jgi:hypothetical protein
MSLPVKLVVEYDDGSTREMDYDRVDGETRYRLARLGLSPAGAHVGRSQHYLLLRWKDGWQEVVGIEAASAEAPIDLLRYYVIERIEDRGRLSLETGGEYPELLVVERTPRDLVDAVIVGEDGVKAYALDSSVERWEGIFEAGGKREYVKFDKTSDNYPHDVESDGRALEPVLEALRRDLGEMGLDPQNLLSLGEAERVGRYKELAAGAGIRGGYRQEDVYGFIESMVTRLTGATR